MKKLIFIDDDTINVDQLMNYDIIILDGEFILKRLNDKYHWAEIFDVYIESRRYDTKKEAVMAEYRCNNECNIKVYNDPQDVINDLFK